jgi:hypothetical protein
MTEELKININNKLEKIQSMINYTYSNLTFLKNKKSKWLRK